MEQRTCRDIELIPIRELNAAELEPLVRSSADEGYNHVARLRDDYLAGSNRFDQAGELLLGAYDRGRLVAVGGLNRDPFVAAVSGDGDGAYGVGRLRRMYVMPDYRRYGIGGRLVRRLLEEAKGAFHTVVLRSAGTAESDAFYRALGFQRAAEGETEHTHYMKTR
jgi:hypothetical protein